MLLNLGGKWGWVSGRRAAYFHVAELRGYPRYMDEVGYQRYLQENGKKELSRRRVYVPNPAGAANKLAELLSKEWIWFVLPNNCANFVEEVLQAGGVRAGLYSNCPTAEEFK